jgi:hypothetical protein
MNTDALKREILENAREVTRLHRRIHETFEMRGKNRASRDAWEAACAEFHSRYNKLAFPGGYEGAETRIVDGDPCSIEAALCFLELRPYFFRSGYMYQSLLRKMKRAVLTQEQSERFKAVLVRVEEWRHRKALARMSNKA